MYTYITNNITRSHVVKTYVPAFLLKFGVRIQFVNMQPLLLCPESNAIKLQSLRSEKIAMKRGNCSEKRKLQ